MRRLQAYLPISQPAFRTTSLRTRLFFTSQHSIQPPPKWTSSASRRRKNIGIPKNVQVDPPAPPPLTADQCPWDDYLIPSLAGNSTPKTPSLYTNPSPFLVLGIESSCDDTAAAVIRSDGTLLGEARISQDTLTQEWGGVVPHVARDAHEQAIQNVIHNALHRSNVTTSDLHAVAATMGPGLEICLRVGYRAARQLARDHCKDFVAVNHLEAHVLVARMLKEVTDRPQFPFLTLLVSGGHCQLLLARSVADYEVLGGTLDDALGEAYDKTARLLGLQVGGGGGPAMEKLAEEGNPKAIPFPVPMSKRKDCNFSFAGLKTSVKVAIDKLGGNDVVRSNRRLMADVAASFQHIAVRHLEQRVERALNVCDLHETGAKTLVVSGGVAANKVVRRRIEELCTRVGWKCIIPPVHLCTDNGVMVAWAGAERLKIGIADDTNHLDVRARWPLAALGSMSGILAPDVEKRT